jgi:hypothetical protein
MGASARADGQLQILKLMVGRDGDPVDVPENSATGRGQAKGRAMYVITIHSVSDPDAFWGGKLDLPQGTELPIVAPSTDGTRGVCVFKSDSLNTVRDLVDGATAAISRNEYFALDEGTAMGLPA